MRCCLQSLCMWMPTNSCLSLGHLIRPLGRFYLYHMYSSYQLYNNIDIYNNKFLRCSTDRRWRIYIFAWFFSTSSEGTPAHCRLKVPTTIFGSLVFSRLEELMLNCQLTVPVHCSNPINRLPPRGHIVHPHVLMSSADPAEPPPKKVVGAMGAQGCLQNGRSQG